MRSETRKISSLELRLNSPEVMFSGCGTLHPGTLRLVSQLMTATPYESRFTSKIELVKQWSVDNGDCNIPVSAVVQVHGTMVRLGRWVDYIRGQYRAGRLPDERVTMLEIIPGWTWEPRRRGPVADTHKVRDSQIRELRREGITLEAIAYSFGLSKQRIAQICTGG